MVTQTTTLPETSGVYFLIDLETDETLYVGQAVNLKKRLTGHEIRAFLDRKGIKYTIDYIPVEREDLDGRERDLILSLKPALNTVYNSETKHPLKDEYHAEKIKSTTFVALRDLISGHIFTTQILSSKEYIEYAKQCGEELLKIKQMLKEAKASKNNPVETDMGSYHSYTEFLELNGIDRSTANNYTTLAEDWGIVLKLGMQDKSNVEYLGNSMRVVRTIKVIRWYKDRKQAGYPDELLTIKQYWKEQEEALELAKSKTESTMDYVRTLEEQLRSTKQELSEALNTINELKARLKVLDPSAPY